MVTNDSFCNFIEMNGKAMEILSYLDSSFITSVVDQRHVTDLAGFNLLKTRLHEKNWHAICTYSVVKFI